MFNNKTTIVVGAGASNEVGLPIGKDLKNDIASILDYRYEHGIRRISGDNYVFDAINKDMNNKFVSMDINKYITACRNIREGLPQTISIDNFLDSHQGNEEIELCGKLAIVRAILMAEKNSKLYIDFLNSRNSLNIQDLENTWYNKLMQLLTQNCTIDQLSERLSKIQFVIFNYDRCVEHFLYHSLQMFYNISSAEAATIVNQIEIYHPYGAVGNLPWYNNSDQIEFGSEATATQILNLSKRIKTFTEGSDPESSNIEKIRNSVNNSNILLFLGFAYHPQNLQIISPGEHLNVNIQRSAFGSAFKISSSDTEIIKNEMRNNFGIRPDSINIRNDLTCCNLFDEYWRSLSLS